jgi:acetolactate synthase-1/2/3 large subunit
VDLKTPDFVKVAEGMGLEAEPVKGVAEFKAAFAHAVAAKGPVLLDIDMGALQPMGGLGTPPPRR